MTAVISPFLFRFFVSKKKNVPIKSFEASSRHAFDIWYEGYHFSKEKEE